MRPISAATSINTKRYALNFILKSLNFLSNKVSSKRYNELRQMQKDSTMTADQRREREMREAGMRSISLTTIQNSTSKVSTGANSTASRPGFKSIGGGGGFKKLTAKSTTSAGSAMQKSVAAPDDSDSESELDYVRYDPRQPTSP